MRYPKMAPTRTHQIYVPRLDGGLNLEDIPVRVADNQLTDCRNLWWHDGALRTRPGLTSYRHLDGEYNILQPLGDGELLFIHYQSDGSGKRRFYPLLQRSDGSCERFGLSPTKYMTLSDATDEIHPTAFGCHAPYGLTYDFLFYLSGGEILTYRSDRAELRVESPYVPHVYDDCPPTVHLEEGPTDDHLLEYPNLLSNHCLCTYTTDGKGTYFYLPSEFDATSISTSLTVTDPTNNTPITFTITGTRTFAPAVFELDPALYTQVDLGYQYDRVRGYIRIFGVATLLEGGTEIVPLPYVRHNNVKVSVTGYRQHDPLAVCRMTMGVWYGGNYGSINDGTRLFVAGNDSIQNSLMWSHVNNPLYFPQPNHAHIGDRHSAITALARQSDQLVIFKEHEIYTADYVSHSDPVAAVSPSVMDKRYAWRASFPITPLHRTVGCTCPATVQLVNNKLVWMTASGHLYVLVGVNRHSERNVRDITSMITPALTAHEEADRRNAYAGEYDGRYLLTLGTTMYVLDCRNTAFNGFEQYINENTALQALIYYRWVLPLTGTCRLISGGRSLMIASVQADGIDISILDGDSDYGEAIPVSFTTKMFGCADPTRRMSIAAVCLGLSDTRHRVRVTYHTDRGDYQDAAVLTAGSIRPDPRRITTRRLTPNIRRALWFGITCESDAAFAVTDLGITTRIDAAI